MDSLRLVRGFDALESAAAAVNALVEAGVEHGAITMRSAAVGVYLVVVQAANPQQRDLAQQVLAGIARPTAVRPQAAQPH
jgi:hypothetical protein